MAFTEAIFDKQVAAGVLYDKLLFEPDQSITTQDDDLIVPDFAAKLMGVQVMSPDLLRARVESPSMRAKLVDDVDKLHYGANQTEDPRWQDKILRPTLLNPSEGLQVHAGHGNIAAQHITALVWLLGEMEEIPSGDITTIKAVSSTTLVSRAWTLCPLLYTQQLPAGRYAIVGARFFNAHPVGARLVITGSPYRPGAMPFNSENIQGAREFDKGRCGKWGEFAHQYPPQAEFWSETADTSEIVYLDVIRIE